MINETQIKKEVEGVIHQLKNIQASHYLVAEDDDKIRAAIEAIEDIGYSIPKNEVLEVTEMKNARITEIDKSNALWNIYYEYLFPNKTTGPYRYAVFHHEDKMNFMKLGLEKNQIYKIVSVRTKTGWKWIAAHKKKTESVPSIEQYITA